MNVKFESRIYDILLKSLLVKLIDIFQKYIR